MSRTDIESRTEELLIPILEDLSFEFVDVEYVKEGADWYLRAYIDKDGGIMIDDCETVSRLLEARLDEADFIPDAYILEVSSPGLTRPLKKERDYVRNQGKPVEIHLYKAIDGEKMFVGELKEWNDSQVVIDDEGTERTFNKTDISVIRQYFEF